MPEHTPPETLSPTQASGGPSLVQCVVRCPDGSRAAARLPPTAPLAALFWLVDARAVDAALAAGSEFALATQFPRRRFVRPCSTGDAGVADGGADAAADGLSLMDAGLGESPQQAFFVELL